MPSDRVPELGRVPAVVLVVDHDELTRHSIAELVRSDGYICLEAANSDEALGRLDEFSCDLVIADIHMPGNVKLELVKTVSARKDPPPFLLITGHPCVATAASAVQLNVIGYLIKPMVHEELRRMIREGTESSLIHRHLRRRRERLDQYLHDLGQMANTCRSPDVARARTDLSTYLSVSVDHIHEALVDLQALVDSLVARDDSESASSRLSDSRPLVLVNALREVVNVLERTKSSFKSRELAELRRGIEHLLDPGRGPAPGTQEPSHRI